MPFGINRFADKIKEKHCKYYLYNEYLKPVEHAFFGAFLSVYLAFLFSDLLKISKPLNFDGNFSLQKYLLAILITFFAMINLGGITVAFDYTLRPGTRTMIYILAIVGYTLFSWAIMNCSGVYPYLPNILKIKSICTLPILFIFWIIYRELMRVYSKVRYRLNKEDIFSDQENISEDTRTII